MEFFNFGLEQKLDRQSRVEFHRDSDGDGINFSKPQLNPLKHPLGAPKDEILQLWTRTKVRPTFLCRISLLHGDSDGNGFKAQRPIIGLLIDSN